MIFLTTTAIDLDEELLNRCLVLTVNEDREQTQAIHRLQREQQTLEGLLARAGAQEILKVHRNAQRLLKPLFVANPYARELTFSDSQTRTRRDHTKYLTLIRSIALLHQYQRPMQDRHASRENRLLHRSDARPISRRPTGWRMKCWAVRSTNCRRKPAGCCCCIEEMVRGECARLKMERSDFRFSRRDVRAYTGWGDTQLRVHLHRLEELEYLLVHRGGRGQSFVYELMFAGERRGRKTLFPGLIEREARNYATTERTRG